MMKVYDSDNKLSDINVIDGLVYELYDESSNLIIHLPCSFKKTKIIVGKKCTVELGAGIVVKKSLTIYTKNHHRVSIGNNFNVRSAEIVCRSEPKTFVEIGNDVLASSELVIRASDAHTVYDCGTKMPINCPKSGVKIGNHVWIGQRVTLLKDVIIPNNCVISLGAIVTSRKFEDNSIIAGVPAKTIKSNINWSPYNTFNYCKINNINRDKII